MTVSIVIPRDLMDSVVATARRPEESAGVLLAGVARAPNGDVRLLARDIRWVPDAAYAYRSHERLSIRSEGYIRALGEAELAGATCLWIHTHPGLESSPLPSDHDRVVDAQLADVFRLRTGSSYYGALVFAPTATGVTFSGHIQLPDEAAQSIDRLWEVGSRWRLVRAYDSELPPLPPMYDRNVRAFGSAIQQTLADLRIAIVGCGGTGSSVGEQLVRMGVRHLTLVDPDTITESNITRVYGSSPSVVARHKVNVLAEHFAAISSDVKCSPMRSMVTLEETARALVSADLVFGCTDDNAGRMVLSRLATYLLTPVIDCGVLLSSDESGSLVGIDGRVTVLTPGQACLVCRGRIDLRRAAAELLTPDERVRREDEGYAPALGRTEPSVISYTTLVAATAVSELLERLVGYGPTPRPSEVLLRCHEREVSTNLASPRNGHYCDPGAGKLGRGSTEPFLEQTWPT
jgi:molybdopterin/thiamine biosynthesis adenylyltransferase/proteasome lid subunit RPN8/RPN11